MDAQKLDFLLLDQMLSQLVTSKRLEQRRNLQLGQRRLLRTTRVTSPDRVSGTAFLMSSVIRHCRCQSSENC